MFVHRRSNPTVSLRLPLQPSLPPPLPGPGGTDGLPPPAPGHVFSVLQTEVRKPPPIGPTGELHQGSHAEGVAVRKELSGLFKVRAVLSSNDILIIQLTPQHILR